MMRRIACAQRKAPTDGRGGRMVFEALVVGVSVGVVLFEPALAVDLGVPERGEDRNDDGNRAVMDVSPTSWSECLSERHQQAGPTRRPVEKCSGQQ